MFSLRVMIVSSARERPVISRPMGVSFSLRYIMPVCPILPSRFSPGAPTEIFLLFASFPRSAWPDAQARKSFATGAREVVPALIATSIWAFVTGVAMVKAGMSTGMALLMSLTVYAGSAQLTALPLMVAGAPLWLVFAAGMVVNIRFLIFGAALQPYFRHYSWPKRLALGFWSSDIGFALFMTRYGHDGHAKGTRDQLWYYLGIILPGWVSWQALTAAGIFAGGLFPDSWGLGYAATLALMAITVPLVKTRPLAAAMLAAGVVAWLGQPLPLRLGLAAAVVAGIAAGVAAERHVSRERRGKHEQN